MQARRRCLTSKAARRRTRLLAEPSRSAPALRLAWALARSSTARPLCAFGRALPTALFASRPQPGGCGEHAVRLSRCRLSWPTRRSRTSSTTAPPVRQPRRALCHSATRCARASRGACRWARSSRSPCFTVARSGATAGIRARSVAGAPARVQADARARACGVRTVELSAAPLRLGARGLTDHERRRAADAHVRCQPA